VLYSGDVGFAFRPAHSLVSEREIEREKERERERERVVVVVPRRLSSEILYKALKLYKNNFFLKHFQLYIQ